MSEEKIKLEDLARRAIELFDELEANDVNDTLLIMSGTLANDLAALNRNKEMQPK